LVPRRAAANADSLACVGKTSYSWC
jgi:hypothetical protein